MPSNNRVALLALGAALTLGPARPLAAQSPVVHAVLFFSPSCPHCHKVITEDLPRIFARFGGPPLLTQGTAGHVIGNGKVEILLVDVSFPAGFDAYEAAGESLKIPEDGVPRLVCGDSVLVGDVAIPTFFPRLITAGLDHGGVDWPAIDGLDLLFPPAYVRARESVPLVDTVVRADTAVAAVPADTAVPTVAVDTTVPTVPALPTVKADTALRADTGLKADAAVATVRAGEVARTDTNVANVMDVISTTSRGSVIGRTLRQDPVGAMLAIGLILVMSFSLTWVVLRGPSARVMPPAVVPALVLVGVAIAAYLAYVEVSGARAVCGPVGDCNAVQQSAYARLFGVPVALIGIGGYLAILVAWLFARQSRGARRVWAGRVVLMLTLVGTVGSLVLTILEPFVIGAVCLWCCTSAVLMTALLWIGPAISDAPQEPSP